MLPTTQTKDGTHSRKNPGNRGGGVGLYIFLRHLKLKMGSGTSSSEIENGFQDSCAQSKTFYQKK